MLGKVACMVTGKVPTDLLGILIVAVALITTLLPTDAALSCFSSSSVILVGVLSVLAAGLIHSGVLDWMVRNMFGNPKTYEKALIRLMLPATIMSAFISNLAVVQLLISTVKTWGKRLNIPPSKLLIPLSFASTLGGVCTLIGNAPNLVISEFYTDQTGHTLSIFTPLVPGLCCTVAGFAVIMVLSRRLIPERRSPEESFGSSAEYTVELLVPTECQYVGDTIEDAGLYSVNGGHLIEIVRFDREVISPVPRDEFIIGGDRLVYSGQISSILNLRETHGLVSATHHVFNISEMDRNRKLQMASVDINSPLVARRMVDTNFEDSNNVVLVAIAREGERLTGIPREEIIYPGDTLLLEGSKLAPQHFTDNLHFFDSVDLPKEGKRTLLSSLIMLGMIILSITHVMPLLNSCFLAAIIMGITHCISPEQIQRSINWKMLMVFAGSVCLGKAIEVSGIAEMTASTLLSISGTSPLIALIVIAFTATFVTEFISNATAAAIFAPVALDTAQSLGVNSMPFVISLMLAISCSFATPIGSETNTLIYGPGGYKFGDYLRIGICMNIILLIVNIIVVTAIYPF